MFIELTDHLRCPTDHEEAYLVLLPTAMEGRRVQAGVLGCPVCQREVPLIEGVVDFGDAPAPPAPTQLPAEAVPAFLGLGGPGGYVVLVGGAADLAPALVDLMPGIRFVLVNPPAGTVPTEQASVLRAGRLPVKGGSMRGAVLPADHASRPGWLDDTVACVLPGLRVVVEGAPSEGPGLEVMAEAGGWWVGKRR